MCDQHPDHAVAVQWYTPNLIEYENVVAIASGDGRRVFALVSGAPVEIVEIRPDGSEIPFYQGSPGSAAISMAIASDGHMFLANGGPTSALMRISPAGVLEGSYPLTSDNIAVGADGCTIYYRTGSNDIRRINGCTGAALPDFANGLLWINDFLELPDGQVLVASGDQVNLYDATGMFVRTVASLASYGLENRDAHAITVRNGVLFIAATDWCVVEDSVLLAIALSNGDELSRRPLAMTSARAIVAAANGPTIPTLSEMALALLAFVLAAGGALVLKLR